MKRIQFLAIVLILSIGATSLQAQSKKIALEDIWQRYMFFGKSVPGFNFLKDGQHYSRKQGEKIMKYDFKTGEAAGTIFDAASAEGLDKFDSYTFSANEQKILLKTETESIYRRSTRAFFHVWDPAKKTLSTIDSENKIRYCSFSPDGTKVAYVSGNDLYTKDLATDKVTRITSDGAYNSIINGATDWVYEEEFAIAKGFQWSPDSKRIAFMRFDESQVKEFTMNMYRDKLYPEPVTFKYPKVGEDNAVVSVHVYDLASAKTTKVADGKGKDNYYPRIKWTQNPEVLSFIEMNRHQNHIKLHTANAKTGAVNLLYEEKNKYYVAESVLDYLTFLEDGKCFLWTSEKDGYHHIYLIDMKGRVKKQLTKGNWDVTAFYGVDEKRKKIYYQSAETSPLERQVYAVGLNGRKKTKLTPKKGTNRAQFSSTFDYYTLTHSTANQPATYAVYDVKGNMIRGMEDNKVLASRQTEYGTTPVEFFDFKTSEDVSLNGYMIKPADFDATKKYPVLMYVYGGPGSQTVNDSFGGSNYWWFQMLAQQGYIVVSIDNRGTGSRGQEFKKMTYLQLGKYETMDQIEGAKYLASQPYVDGGRIGIFGWSYGGYMSSLCITKGADVFKAAIAVAPVTSWKWYDTIYTERYMRTLKENESGYKDNSPIYFADKLKGNYLLIHGMGDDNVHFQHTVEMAGQLINNNKQFDTYFYPNKNHGIYGGYARLHLYQKMTDFLMEKL